MNKYQQATQKKAAPPRRNDPYATSGAGSSSNPYRSQSSSSPYSSSRSGSSGNPYDSFRSSSSGSLYGRSRSGSSSNPYDSSRSSSSGSSAPGRKPVTRKASGMNWRLPAIGLVLLLAVGILLVVFLGGPRPDGIAPNPSSAPAVTATATRTIKATPAATNSPKPVVTIALPTYTPKRTNTPIATPNSTPGATKTPAQFSLEPSSPWFRSYPSSLRWFYANLTDEEKSLFALLYDGIAKQAAEVTLPKGIYTEKQLDRVLSALQYDCPELVHYSGHLGNNYTTMGRYIHSVTLNYSYPTLSESTQAVEQVLQAAEKLLTAEERSTDTLHREHTLYTKIIQKASYDKEFEYCANADSVYLYGLAKCSGYAAAFDLACRMHGIPSIKVNGFGTTETGTESHVWNYVQIDGDWYVCDPTWDRATYESYSALPAPVNGNLNYFNCTQQQLKKTHTLDGFYKTEKWELPACNSTAAAFHENFLPVTDTDKDWEKPLVEQLHEAINEKRSYIALRCEKDSQYQHLIDNFDARITKWSKTTGYPYAYSFMQSDRNRILWLYNIKQTAENHYRQDNLWVRFFDVGDADAAVVYCEGKYMLIDGGTERGASRLLYTFLEDNRITHVDAIIATHPHSDHVGGLPGALSYQACTFGKLYSPVRTSDNEGFQTLLTIAAKRGLTPTVPTIGTRFSLGGATVTFVSPDPERSYENVNNKSLVVRIDYGETSFLFTGDAMENAEMDMCNGDRTLLDCDVLKVAHHGADTSTTQFFLNAVTPFITVISCGGDSDTHPSKELLERINATGATVFRTDLNGDIVLFSDGKELQYILERKEE